MFSVLIKIIPLDLASALSPGIFAVALLLLANKHRHLLRTLSFLVGALIVGVIITFLGFFLGKNATTHTGQSEISAIADLVLGIFFIVFAVKLILVKEKKLNLIKDNEGHTILKWLIVGLVGCATNFDAVLLNFTAAKEVGEAGIAEIEKLILLLINIAFFTLPITFPLIFYLIFPKLAEPILAKVNRVVLKYSKYIIFILFLIFGIFLLYKGLKFFR